MRNGGLHEFELSEFRLYAHGFEAVFGRGYPADKRKQMV